MTMFTEPRWWSPDAILRGKPDNFRAPQTSLEQPETWHTFTICVKLQFGVWAHFIYKCLDKSSHTRNLTVIETQCQVSWLVYVHVLFRSFNIICFDQVFAPWDEWFHNLPAHLLRRHPWGESSSRASFENSSRDVARKGENEAEGREIWGIQHQMETGIVVSTFQNFLYSDPIPILE